MTTFERDVHNKTVGVPLSDDRSWLGWFYRRAATRR
jgi:hypothetical protein